MSVWGLSDRAQLFLNMRQNVDIRSRLNAKTLEMSTGQVSDLVAHLKGDTAPLADLDRRLALAEAYGSASREATNRLSFMQEALEQTERARASLAADLMAPRVVGDPDLAAKASRAAFDTIVSALNTQMGDNPLFAGTDFSGAALAPAQTMMTEILATVAGATSAADVSARLDSWFDAPGGGFETIGYQGSASYLQRPIDSDVTATFGVRADDPALRSLLKAAALGALAGEATLSLPADAAKAMIEQARDAVISLSQPLTEVRGALGQVQFQVEEATARHTARASAWSIMRNEMTQADPFAVASEVEALRTQLETHYELMSRLSTLNLMSHLR